jgi:hypothetical protein
MAGMQKADSYLRLTRMTLLLTETERGALERAARREHSTLSEVIRRRVFVGPDAVPLDEDAADD